MTTSKLIRLLARAVPAVALVALTLQHTLLPALSASQVDWLRAQLVHLVVSASILLMIVAGLQMRVVRRRQEQLRGAIVARHLALTERSEA